MKTITELTFNFLQIKKLTPYLDKIESPSKNKKSNNKTYISLKHRAFAWYYIFNGNNKSNAWERAYLNTSEKLNKFNIKYSKSKTNSKTLVAVFANELFKKPYIQEAVKLLTENIIKNIKAEIPQTLLEQLFIQATFDPFMFIDKDGKFKFESEEDIPKKYRCCFENIEVKYPGGNKVVTYKLVSREEARRELLKLAPDLYVPEKTEIIHKTIDSEGNETGFDYTKLSNEQLEAIIDQEGRD